MLSCILFLKHKDAQPKVTCRPYGESRTELIGSDLLSLKVERLGIAVLLLEFTGCQTRILFEQRIEGRLGIKPHFI
jgi:hypothetical protein